MSFPRPPCLVLTAALLLAGCAVGPAYERPEMPLPAAYKEAPPGWEPAAPADGMDRGLWWHWLADPELDALMQRVEVSNQNVAAATAAYAQAQALAREQQASLFPTVSLTAGATRSGGEGSARAGSSGGSGSGSGGSGTRYQVGIGGTWEPDVWGRLQQGVSAAGALAQASAADLAAARLSAQGALAVDYIGLRQSDTQAALLDATLDAYRRALQIARNRHAAGLAPRTDVLQAQSQLAGAEAERVGLARQRAQLEHAIAVLTGQPPAGFGIAPRPGTDLDAAGAAPVPELPAGLPSTLLQRRPDIAAAERRVAQANAQIGVARAAYFPSISLNASRGSSASRVGELFNASSALWSLGVQAAQSVFDAGATRERVAGARAAHEEAVARYRQTVLAAFQDVEDQLAASRVLAQQQAWRREAAQAADEAQAQTLNRYRAGQVGYAEVVVTQTGALAARRALAQLGADRQTAAVALILALGGGWHADAAAPPAPPDQAPPDQAPPDQAQAGMRD